MMGTKYLEHAGKMTIRNNRTGGRCVLEFKENGYWGPTNLVSGTVFSPSGETLTQLEGKFEWGPMCFRVCSWLSTDRSSTDSGDKMVRNKWADTKSIPL